MNPPRPKPLPDSKRQALHASAQQINQGLQSVREGLAEDFRTFAEELRGELLAQCQH